MKTTILTLPFLCLATATLLAQSAPVVGRPDSSARIVAIGPHSRVWSRTEQKATPSGRVRDVEHRYVELATGMYYERDGQLQESKEVIESIPGGAVARQGQHKVFFSRNLATAGAIDLEMPDGQRLRSHVLGLAYFDSASSKSVMIAEVKDCEGTVEGNRVLYKNAFTEFLADVRLTYTRAGFEQDIILRERPPEPKTFGLDPRTTRLQVYTEFLSSPLPVTKLERRARVDGTETVDSVLDFGSMRMGQSKALRLDRVGRGEVVPVQKSLRKLEGRDFLIEEVPLPDVTSELEALPLHQGASLSNGTNTIKRTASLRLPLPPAPQAAREVTNTPMLASRGTAPTAGFVLDYPLELKGTTNDFTFQGDTTYLVTGPFTVNGELTIEGGSVIKYTNNAAYYAGAYVQANGGVVCKTAPHNMAVLTSQDDNSVGELVSGSTGSPTVWRSYGLIVGDWQTLRHLRFMHAHVAVMSGFGLTVKDCQFVNCSHGVDIWNSSLTLRNDLFTAVGIPINVSVPNAAIVGEQVTVDQFQALVNINASVGALSSVALTNSLLTRGTSWLMTNWVANAVSSAPANFHVSAVVWDQAATGFYQSAGSGNYYLAADSPYRNAGVTEVSTNVLALIRASTTYPPFVISNTLSTYNHPLLASAMLSGDTTFSPQAQRDTDGPDLGYHYAPLDYLMNNVQASNITVRVTDGAVLGYGNDIGLWLFDQSILICEGTPNRLNAFVHHTCVQEQPVIWAAGGFDVIPVLPCRMNITSIEASFRFTQFAGYSRNFMAKWRPNGTELRE